MGKMIKRKVFASGQIQSGIKLEAHPSQAGSRRTRRGGSSPRLHPHFPGAAGPVAVHPFFGPLTHAEWCRLHTIHCAHHLSFVLPSEGE